MKRSLFFRLFVSYLFLVVALTGVILVVTWSSIKNDYVSTLKNSLKQSTLMLTPILTPLVEQNRLDELQDRTKLVGGAAGIRITVIDGTGTVLADSAGDVRHMENHAARPEFAEALQGRVDSAIRYSSTEGEYLLYVALPVEESDGKVIGAIRSGVLLRDVENLLAGLRRRLIIAGLLILPFAFVAAFVLSRAFSKPVRELTDAVRRVSSGDFGVRLHLHGGGELRQLSDSFNAMSDQIETMMAQATGQKEKLGSIVGSLQEGLAVIDEQGRITRANQSFERIVQASRVEGRPYWQVFKSAHLMELIEKVRSEKKNLVERLYLDDSAFLCSITRLQLKNEIVIVLHDITQLRDVERLKRDFVVNISHELRTPLTAVKGFTETLMGEADPGQRHYLEIIERNTDRLINIINDLLLLSELEEKGMKMEPERIDFGGLVENTLKIFEERAKEKGLEISSRIDPGLPPVTGDSFKLEQVMINLMDNAIKYTESGSIGIRVISRETGWVTLHVWDSGIGIPAEDISRVFERFYVVDKSRSKRVGGTGLGLSIVKHIILLHNGSVEIKSRPGKGTIVRIRLPVDQPGRIRAQAADEDRKGNEELTQS